MSDLQRPSSKVTLEDLLRVKRAERPAPEFWVEFERSLRAKQLAAIVEKRPWWRSWSGISRWSLPLGAAAALTITIATVNRSTHPAPAPQTTNTDRPATAEQVKSAPVAVVSNPISTPAPAAEVSTAAPVITQASSSTELAKSEPAPVAAQPVSVAVNVPTPTRLPSVSEQIAGIGAGAAEADHAATPRFASVVQKDSAADEFTRYFDHGVARLDADIQPGRAQVVEPLAQVTSPHDARRARVLAYLTSGDNRPAQYSDTTNVNRRRERVASHLSEEALYDSIRRLGIKDGGVSIQF